MTTPTSVLLDTDLKAAAKRRAAERGLSVSAYIRELIRDDADASSVNGSAAGDISILAGLCRGGEPTSIARDKDEIIGQAFLQTAD